MRQPFRTSHREITSSARSLAVLPRILNLSKSSPWQLHPEILQLAGIVAWPTSLHTMDAVLYTAELCEMIVLQVSGIDIYNCMRVCRALKATVNASQKVKRILFLAAEPENANVWHINRIDGTVRIASIAARPFFPQTTFVYIRQPVRLNTLVLRSASHSRTGNLDIDGILSRCAVQKLDFVFHPKDAYFTSRANPDIYGTFFTLLDTTALPKDASCLECFVTQPPVQRVKLILTFIERSEYTGITATLFPASKLPYARKGYLEQTVEDAGGVKLGTVFKEWEILLREYGFEGLISEKAWIEIDGMVWATEEQMELTKKVEIMPQ